MKTKITLLSLLISTQIFAEDKLNIYPDVSQYVFEKEVINKELEIELPDSYQLNTFYIQDKNGVVPKYYEFKNKSEINLKENSEVLIAGQLFKFKNLMGDKLIVEDSDKKINVFNFNNLNSFSFSDKSESYKNSIQLFELNEGVMAGSYLFGNIEFDYKKNMIIDSENKKGYLNTEFIIKNNTDQDFKNVETSIMFERIGSIQNNNVRNYEMQETMMLSKSTMADSGVMVIDKEVSEKKNVYLGNINIPAKKTKIVKHIDNINFDFNYSYKFNINFDKKTSTIYPNYSLLINKNKENEKLFDIEDGQGYIYDKISGLILNNLQLNKTEDEKLFIELGKSNTTKLIISEINKFNILNPQNTYLKNNYYVQNINYIESEFKFDNLKENSDIEFLINNSFLVKEKINEEDLKFFKDKLELSINSAIKRENIQNEVDRLLREFLKDKLITMEEYKKSDNYKNGLIYIVNIR